MLYGGRLSCAGHTWHAGIEFVTCALESTLDPFSSLVGIIQQTELQHYSMV